MLLFFFTFSAGLYFSHWQQKNTAVPLHLLFFSVLLYFEMKIVPSVLRLFLRALARSKLSCQVTSRLLSSPRLLDSILHSLLVNDSDSQSPAYGEKESPFFDPHDDIILLDLFCYFTKFYFEKFTQKTSKSLFYVFVSFLVSWVFSSILKHPAYMEFFDFKILKQICTEY